ncbi:MAG: hypothetical protein COA79_18220 [Planctomycetota bacterium]|nr:MAG: hypothetical protein COA79_18220 [Planctomycetota bacterium]
MLRTFNNSRRKIAFIGASFKFVHQCVRDMIIAPALSNTDQFENTDIFLYDLDQSSLQLEHDIIKRMAKENGSAITVTMSKSREDALKDADYVVVSVLIGGMDVAEEEDNICQEFGIRHTVGDTIGPMCTARCLRMVPLLLDIAYDMEKFCPKAPMLSVTNPMTVLTNAVNQHTKINCIGICHGTESQVKQIAKVYNVDRNDVCVDCVGVNHLGFITRVEVNGQTLEMETLVEKMGETLQKGYVDPATGVIDNSNWAYDFFKLTKYLPNNGDHHFVEFFPWFLSKGSFKDGKSILGIDEKLHDPDARRKRRQWFYDTVAGWAYAPESQKVPDMHQYSNENIVDIISGLENRGVINASELHLNMTNGGAVPNLPHNANLELTCHITPRGMMPIQFDPLPPLLLGILTPLIAINELTMKAAVEKDKQAFMEALILDPLLQEFHTIEKLADKLWAVNEKHWTPVK